jgi:hypothetical protein
MVISVEKYKVPWPAACPEPIAWMSSTRACNVWFHRLVGLFVDEAIRGGRCERSAVEAARAKVGVEMARLEGAATPFAGDSNRFCG